MIKSSLLNKVRNSIVILSMGFGYCNCNSQNLIANGSFENYNTPQNWNNWGGGFFDISVFPAQRILLDWDQFNSPDYFVSACPHIYCGLPNNIFGNSIAKAGNGYAGFGSFPSTGDYSEYAYQHLSSPLQAGTVYCLSFYVSRADNKEYALKNIGAYFSVSTPTMVSSTYINSFPQILNQNGFITDTTAWTEIYGCYTALGGEQYITIGNFNSGGNSDTLYAGTNNPIPSDPKYAYYYIDEVTLYDQTTVGLIENNFSNQYEIYPNPTTGKLKMSRKKSALEITRIKITDVLGKEIYEEKYNEEIDISNIQNGIYLLNLYNNGLLISTKKLIKE